MRKITLFLALMLTCVSTVMAQWSGKGIASVSETPATTLTDGYYVIYNNGRGTFMNTEGALGQAKVTWPTTANATGVAALASADALNNSSGSTNKMAYVFYVNVEGSTMSLKTGYEDYVPVLTANVTFNYVADEAFWNYEVVEGGFVFLKGETVGLDCNGWTASDHTYSTAAGWTADGSKNTNGNQSWSFYAVDLKDVAEVNVTYNYQLNGVTKKTETIVQIVGDAYAAPAIDYVTFAQPEGVVPAENTSVNIECTQNLPFTISENFENATWYFMTIRSNNEKYVVRSEETPYSNTATINLSDDGLWAFTGNVFDGIQVINKGAGNGQTLGCDATTDASAIFMKEGNTSWIIEEGNGGFLLRQDGDNQYAHDLGSTLKFWVNASAASDAGSAFKVYSVAETLESLLQEWKESTTAGLGYVGGYPTSMKETINAISTYADAIAFDEANATSKIALIPGNYYRVQNVLRERMIGVDAAGQRVPTTIGKADASQIWTFETGAEDGKYYIKNLNGGDNGYMKDPVGGNDLTTVDAATLYTLTDLGDAQFNIGNGNDLLVDYGGDKGLGVWWGNGKGSDGAWYIIPATELEVALNTVDGASYATGYYPFPVSASGNTTLNVGVLNADKSKLGLAVAEGVPANTGVVIVNSAAEPTTTLTIGGEFEAAGSNALTGSCTAVTENIANYLVLGVGATTGALGFYETTATEIPANKAFLEAGSLSAVKLDLGGDVTAIESVEHGNTNAPIFDLSGRRVLVPAKGGVYVRDGKKFIVK